MSGHAPSVAAEDADLVDTGTNQLAGRGQQNDFVVFFYEECGNDLAVSLGRLDRNNAFVPRPWRVYSASGERLP